MKKLISESRLKIAAWSIIEDNELTTAEATEKIRSLGYFLQDEGQKIAFHVVCTEIQLELSEKLTETYHQYEKPICNQRPKLLNTINELNRKLALAEQVSEITQTTTDHSIRGAIFSINNFLRGPAESDL